jgi:hypothetical protein
VKHLAALRRENAAGHTLGAFLADEFSLHSVVQRPDDDIDRPASLVLAEEPGVHERGVRDVQGVFRHSIERPRHLKPLSNR